MFRLQTSYLHRGNTFFGDVDVAGDGADSVVSVRYNGMERSSRLDGFTVEIVAHLLLKDLVLLEFETINAETDPARAGHGSGTVGRAA